MRKLLQSRKSDLLLAMLAIAALQLALLLSGYSGRSLPWGGASAAVAMCGKVLAYSLAFGYCRAIATEYRPETWLRRAWNCMSLFAGVSVIRYLFDTQLIEAFWPGYWHGQVVTVLREVPGAVSLFFLACGVTSMAVAFLKTRLGFSLRGIDYVSMTCIFGFLLMVLYLRDDMSAASRLRHWVPRNAQLASHMFFCVTAAGAIVLLRLSRQMQGGQLALSMAWIIVHIGTRALLVAVVPFEGNLTAVPHLKFLESLVYESTPWMFTVAAACRYHLTAGATDWSLNASTTAEPWQPTALPGNHSPQA